MIAKTRIVMLLVGSLVLAGTYALLFNTSCRARGAEPMNPPPVGSAVVAGSAPSGSAAARAAPAAPGSAPGTDRVVPVATATVVKRDVPIIHEGLGTVTSLATITVRTIVDGTLTDVLYKEGQDVKKGDLLAVVDTRPFAIQQRTAEAALQRDEAQLADARLNLERYETLRKGNLIAQQQLDDQRALVGQLEGTTRGDHAQIDNAKLQLDFAHIRSPVDGVTGVRLVDQGNIVHAADTTGIVIVTKLDPITVIFTLPQDDLPAVQAALAKGKPEVVAYARDGVQKLGEGELLVVDNQVNAATATIRLRAVMPNPHRALWPNAFVKARVRVATVTGALVVPGSAVQRGPNGTFAYVVSADQVATPKPVVLELIQGDVAVISSGLNEGEIVVTDGQNQLRPGSRVSAHAATPATPATPAAPKATP